MGIKRGYSRIEETDEKFIPGNDKFIIVNKFSESDLYFNVLPKASVKITKLRKHINYIPKMHSES